MANHRAEPTRQRASYRYRNDKLEVIHWTSVPKTDEEAIEYSSNILEFGKGRTRYIEYRDFGALEHTSLCEIAWDDEDKKESDE